ncbi:MAG: BrnT family toxin [Alphaproteobacteria bacterium]|nr:BrnT family toxin [Alphaproteobacteria bacterium]
MIKYLFEWDDAKDAINQEQYGIAFTEAQEAFYDENRIIAYDEAHSKDEERLFCIGKTPKGVLTVRFTVRGKRIRIIGAGKWRKGRKLYEEKRRT